MKDVVSFSASEGVLRISRTAEGLADQEELVAMRDQGFCSSYRECERCTKDNSGTHVVDCNHLEEVDILIRTSSTPVVQRCC